jgi:hypothetical protein
MKKFPVNRDCPITGSHADELVGHFSVAQVIRGNEVFGHNETFVEKREAFDATGLQGWLGWELPYANDFSDHTLQKPTVSLAGNN